MLKQLRMRFPDGRAKTFTMSYDDGVEQDIRLLALMRENGVRGTFNISSGEYPAEGNKWPEGQVHRRMTLSECQSLYIGDDIEIAIHGTHHPWWDSQPSPTAMWDIINDRIELERQYGRIVRGSAYPFGAFSDRAVEILRLAGIAYSRTVISSHNFAIPRDWLRLQATCHHRDAMLPELTERFLGARAYGEPLMFYLWGHSYEFEGNDNWNLIEEFIPKIAGHDDIWYATNIEIYDYTHAFEQLIYSADGDMIYNPTATDLWAFDGEKTFRIPSGETVTL